MGNFSRLRVGAVSYLNTRPLVYGLAERAPEIDLMFDLPSRLADRLATSQLDVALIPCIEYFQDPAYSIVSDACIACRGPVLSVKLYSRVHPAQIKTLALDEGSRTSASLLRILLRERFNLRPRLERLPIGSGTQDTRADAILLIGDRAMHPPRESFVAEWDLGEEWTRWSGLPFVFAMWVARPDVDCERLEAVLAEVRDAGVREMRQVARESAADAGLPEDLCLRYFRDNLHFHLGERERRGLELFRQHAVALGLAPPDRPRPRAMASS